jgi:hypothetical protein
MADMDMEVIMRIESDFKQEANSGIAQGLTGLKRTGGFKDYMMDVVGIKYAKDGTIPSKADRQKELKEWKLATAVTDKGRIHNYTIGEWFMNTKIPKMLGNMKLPDTPRSRVMAYNWGIGHVENYYNGKAKIPNETYNYIANYENWLAMKSSGDEKWRTGDRFTGNRGKKHLLRKKK